MSYISKGYRRRKKKKGSTRDLRHKSGRMSWGITRVLLGTGEREYEVLVIRSVLPTSVGLAGGGGGGGG